MSTIRVALAEDNVLLREGVSRLVSAHPDFELVGTASDLPELLAVIESSEPDVVITDIRMPPTGRDEGIQAAAWLREHRPQVGVVVLSQYTAPGYAVSLLEHGSAGRAYLLKERVASVDDLVRAIRAVASGGSVIDPLVVDELVKSRSHPNASSLDPLTARETQILSEMAQGKNNAAIAAAVAVSERAVEKHTNSIFAKLGLSEEKDVNRRVMAVLLFLGRGQEEADPTALRCGSTLPARCGLCEAEDVTGSHSVLVVDDQAPFRMAVKAVLRRLPCFQLAGEASSGSEAIALVGELHPALVLMDINMPEMNGIEATRRIVAAHPDVVVFLCSTYDLADLPRSATESGASGYVNKERFGADALRQLWQNRDSGAFARL